MLSFTIGRSSISIMIDGEFNTVDKSAHNYELLKAELQKPEDERDTLAIRNLISTKKMIEAFSYGKVQITTDERVLYDGKEITNYLAERMLMILSEGFDVTPFAKFMERVYANPAEYTRDELYEWLEAANLPIMSDGRIVAFKKVRKDYKDCHSGLFDNSVGAILAMERSDCDPNRGNECSTGFHFCSAGYLKHFSGERVMVLAIDPADVTAIPKDYNRTKGRTCRYEVIGELDDQSEAYKEAWNRGVVEFDNDTELPEVKFEQRPKSVKLKPMKLDRDKASFTGMKRPTPVSKQITPARAPAKPIVSPVVLAFSTTDNRTFTETQIVDALAKNNGGLRPAARDLGVSDSSLRSWLKKIEERKASMGPGKVPNAASRNLNGDLIFKTLDGREFNERTVKTALADNNNANRPTARALGINDSTLRGWRKKGQF